MTTQFSRTRPALPAQLIRSRTGFVVRIHAPEHVGAPGFGRFTSPKHAQRRVRTIEVAGEDVRSGHRRPARPRRSRGVR